MKTQNLSRRDLRWLLPALSAGVARAQEGSRRLPSRIYKFEDLPVKKSAASTSHAVLDGEMHTGVPIEVHVTELPAGGAPHPPHRHIHEEMFLIQAGTVEVTVNGTAYQLTPGSVGYVNSNDLHGIRNPGPGRAEYFVVAIGGKA